jgi:hypothetical protein
MSMSKPVIVQGEGGFSLPFLPQTEDTFLWQGFWGVGDGGSGADELAAHIRALADDGNRRSRLGKYGRSIVVERFSLRRAADIMEGIYTDVIGRTDRPAVSTPEAARVAARALRLEIHHHLPSVKRRRASVERARLEAAALESLDESNE